MRHALVDAESICRDVVLLEPDAEWPVPDGMTMIALDGDQPAAPGWLYDPESGAFADPESEPEASPHELRKLLLLDRIIAAGLFTAAMTALGGPGDLAYERWSAAQVIASDDPQVRGLLAAIGGDPDELLAPE